MQEQIELNIRERDALEQEFQQVCDWHLWCRFWGSWLVIRRWADSSTNTKNCLVPLSGHTITRKCCIIGWMSCRGILPIRPPNCGWLWNCRRRMRRRYLILSNNLKKLWRYWTCRKRGREGLSKRSSSSMLRSSCWAIIWSSSRSPQRRNLARFRISKTRESSSLKVF